MPRLPGAALPSVPLLQAGCLRGGQQASVERDHLGQLFVIYERVKADGDRYLLARKTL